MGEDFRSIAGLGAMLQGRGYANDSHSVDRMAKNVADLETSSDLQRLRV
jgi:hypothetical protein